MRWRALVFVFVLGASAAPARAQPRAAATLHVTVVDPSGAVIVGATVTVLPADAATGPGTRTPVLTGDNGIATISGLSPGRYTLRAELPGFEPLELKDVRIRNGDNRQTAMLSLARFEASVTVGQDQQEAASDRRGPSFGMTLSREQIDALADDPSALQQQLLDLAGPGAVIRVDGLEGATLPAKAQVRSVRIARDQFAAELHSAGGVLVEVITQPGSGPTRVSSFMSGRDGGLSGLSPFVPVKGPEEYFNYGMGMSGAFVKNRTSYAVYAGRAQTYDAPNLFVALPTGSMGQALSVKAPRDALYLDTHFDAALTPEQTLRFGYRHYRATSRNLGVGGYDEPARAYTAENRVHQATLQHYGPLSTRAFLRSRALLEWAGTDFDSSTEAVTVRVLDAFTTGGAQRSGGNHARMVTAASDLDYVVGRHAFRTGVQMEGGWYRSNAASNYLGTYTFNNLEALQLGRPSNFTQLVGDPTASFGMMQGGLYVQDDVRLRKNLMLSPGVRYEVQSHVRDRADVGPRLGMTWSPFAGSRTTVRASAGVFYDWLSAATYEQVLRVDGVRQREVNIQNPVFADPGITTPQSGNRYLLDPSYRTPRFVRMSTGVDQAIGKEGRVAATYSYLTGSRMARGVDRNAPVDGSRPDPAFADVIAVVSDAASRQHQLQLDASLHPGALRPVFGGPRVSWTRVSGFANYTLASLRNNTDGPFSVPASGSLAAEWGPSGSGPGNGPGNGLELPWPGVLNIAGVPTFGQDVRNRLNVSVNNQVIRNLTMELNFFASSAPPYTLLTGHDDNQDGIFNDRPAGVGRNSLRAEGQRLMYLQVGYQFALGQAAILPPAAVPGSGGATQAAAGRYRLQLFLRIQNLTNHKNYLGYSGTLTSPFFGQPTAVSGLRKIDAGFTLNF